MLLIFIFLTGSAFAAEPPPLSAESAILIDAHSGRVLYAKNEQEKRPMASTTKITTALIALEKGNLTDIVTVSKNAAETGESSISLSEGEKISLENLLYAMMLPSANDAAVAISEHIGGTEDNFISMMNERVKILGLKDTHYVTPNGLHKPDHYTTAYDLAFVAREALKLPKFREIIATKRREIPWPGNEWDRVLINKNRLLYRYPYAIGVKNGYTRQAGNCLVGAAEKNGLTLIAAVMKSSHVYDETQALLEYGFENFQPLKVASRGELVRNVKVINGIKHKIQVICSRDVIIPVSAQEAQTVKKNFTVAETLQAPVKIGSKVGNIEVFINNISFTKIDLLTAEATDIPITFMITLKETFLFFLKFLT